MVVNEVEFDVVDRVHTCLAANVGQRFVELSLGERAGSCPRLGKVLAAVEIERQAEHKVESTLEHVIERVHRARVDVLETDRLAVEIRQDRHLISKNIHKFKISTDNFHNFLDERARDGNFSNYNKLRVFFLKFI